MTGRMTGGRGGGGGNEEKGGGTISLEEEESFIVPYVHDTRTMTHSSPGFLVFTRGVVMAQLKYLARKGIIVVLSSLGFVFYWRRTRRRLRSSWADVRNMFRRFFMRSRRSTTTDLY